MKYYYRNPGNEIVHWPTYRKSKQQILVVSSHQLGIQNGYRVKFLQLWSHIHELSQDPSQSDQLVEDKQQVTFAKKELSDEAASSTSSYSTWFKILCFFVLYLIWNAISTGTDIHNSNPAQRPYRKIRFQKER